MRNRRWRSAAAAVAIVVTGGCSEGDGAPPWSADHLPPRAEWLLQAERAYDAWFGPEGSVVAVSSSEGDDILLVDVDTGKIGLRIPSGLVGVAHLQFSADGSRLAAVGRAGAALFDADDGRAIASIPRTEPQSGGDEQRALAFDAAGSRLLIGGADGGLQLWSADTGEELMSLVGHNGWINSVAFDATGSRAVSVGRAGDAFVWDLTTGGRLQLDVGSDALAGGWFIGDEAGVVTLGYGGQMILWDAETGERRRTTDVGSVTKFGLSHDGSRVAIGNIDDTGAIWDVPAGTQVARFAGHGDDFTCERPFDFSSDDARFATCGDDGTAMIWDAATGTRLATVEADSNSVFFAVFTPDGSRLVTSGFDSNVMMWRLP